MPHCLYALAKLEKLTHLSLKGCEHFRECIPYASITAITGFKLLQVCYNLFYFFIILIMIIIFTKLLLYNILLVII